MNYLHSLIANSNGTLDKHLLIIEKAMRLANTYTPKRLKFREHIDIVFFDDSSDVIAETHVGGYADSSIKISIPLDGQNLPTFGALFETITHECCHAVRWQNNSEWSDTLLKSILFEGMATKFAVKACDDNSQALDYFQQYVLDNQQNAQQILEAFKDKLYTQDNNHYINFIVGNGGKVPRWAGYVAGYYLAESLMVDHKLSMVDLCSMKYDDMIAMLSSKLPSKTKDTFHETRRQNG